MAVELYRTAVTLLAPLQALRAFEVWARTIAPLGVPRGRNALWSHDGLRYALRLR